jgi:PadR family transcriptional regulator, regulatory protein PadR
MVPALETISQNKLTALRKGVLEFVVLRVLLRKRAYVPDILGELLPTEFETQEGTLYPMLNRMSREGLVEYEWVESTNGPPRKYYAATNLGERHFNEFREYWQHISDTIDRLGDPS